MRFPSLRKYLPTFNQAFMRSFYQALTPISIYSPVQLFPTYSYLSLDLFSIALETLLLPYLKEDWLLPFLCFWFILIFVLLIPFVSFLSIFLHVVHDLSYFYSKFGFVSITMECKMLFIFYCAIFFCSISIFYLLSF